MDAHCFLVIHPTDFPACLGSQMDFSKGSGCLGLRLPTNTLKNCYFVYIFLLLCLEDFIVQQNRVKMHVS